MNILIITDSLSKISGMSNFVFLFKSFLSNSDTFIYIFDFKTKSKDYNSYIHFDIVYINGHFSQIDKFYNRYGRSRLGQILETDLHNTDIIIVSHGWTKIKYNLSFYNFYYSFKNRNESLNRILNYDSILFINNSIDIYRHLDYLHVIQNDFLFKYFDFAKFYIEYLKTKFYTNKLTYSNNTKILIISNPDFAKNLEYLVYIGIKNFNKKNKKIIFLSTKPKNAYFKTLYLLLKILKIKIFYDQDLKYNLLKECSFLFIPSHTEYLPLVALEAFAFCKPVVSLNKITSLLKYKYYHNLK